MSNITSLRPCDYSSIGTDADRHEESLKMWVEGWLASEDAEHDKISVKRSYIDICDGNLYDGLIFSQIVYWHGHSRETGKPRLKIYKDGFYWLAKQHEDWWAECRVGARQARASIDRIHKKGLIVKKIYKFNGVPTVHIRIDWNAFAASIRHNMSNRNDITCQNDSSSNVSSLTETTSKKYQSKITDQATYGSLEANKVSQLMDFEFEEFHHGKKLEDPSLDKRISRSEPTKQILSVGEKDQDPHPQFRATPSPAAKKIRREKTKVIEPTENRQGVFRPVGAGKQIQRAVLKAMQIWVWDEWVKTCNFRMTIAPDGKTWFYDGDKGGWHDEDTLPSLTKMIDLAGAERSSLDAISIDDLNEYGKNLFETLKNDSALLKRFYREPVAVVCEYDLEPVDWDELPEDAREDEDIPIPF